MGETTRLGPSPVLLTKGGDITDLAPLRQELQSLYERLLQLDYLLRDATDRQRFGGATSASAKAVEDERLYLAELDRLMTRIRAVEGQLLVGRRRLH